MFAGHLQKYRICAKWRRFCRPLARLDAGYRPAIPPTVVAAGVYIARVAPGFEALLGAEIESIDGHTPGDIIERLQQ